MGSICRGDAGRKQVRFLCFCHKKHGFEQVAAPVLKTADTLRSIQRHRGGLPVLRTDLHYHMFCVKGKKASDAPHPYKPHPDEEIAEQSGNKIIRHRLIF